MKTLNVESTSDAKAKILDVEVKGNSDMWHLVCKASSKEQGWMKSTKVLPLPHGVVLQVSTQQGGNVAEAVTYIPGASLDDFK